MTQSPKPPEDFAELCRLSANFGADPMHIQGAGGNSSLKTGDVMWIKASGTVLADAETKEVFVATDLAKLRGALETDDPIADQPAAFSLPGGTGLRPSIETSLHAVFAQRIVLHTHCIHTIAHAIRKDPRPALADRLHHVSWAYVDYAKPGANLARSVRAALEPDTNVIVLGNHGLIVAGETVPEVEVLQHRMHERLSLPVSALKTADVEVLGQLARDTDYEPADDPTLHQLALDPQRVAQVTTGSLYPDHVIFCGIAVAALQENEGIETAMERISCSGMPAPVWLIVPGAGVVVRKDAGTPARVMMRCLADVMQRVPVDAALNYLSTDQNLELLNWDAEKYRQQLNAS